MSALCFLFFMLVSYCKAQLQVTCEGMIHSFIAENSIHHSHATNFHKKINSQCSITKNIQNYASSAKPGPSLVITLLFGYMVTNTSKPIKHD